MTTNTPKEASPMPGNNAQPQNTDIRNVNLSELCGLGAVTLTYVSIRDGDYGTYARVLVKTQDGESIGCNIGSQVVIDNLKVAPKGKEDWIGTEVCFIRKESKSSGRPYFTMKQSIPKRAD